MIRGDARACDRPGAGGLTINGRPRYTYLPRKIIADCRSKTINKFVKLSARFGNNADIWISPCTGPVKQVAAAHRFRFGGVGEFTGFPSGGEGAGSDG